MVFRFEQILFHQVFNVRDKATRKWLFSMAYFLDTWWETQFKHIKQHECWLWNRLIRFRKDTFNGFEIIPFNVKMFFYFFQAYYRMSWEQIDFSKTYCFIWKNVAWALKSPYIRLSNLFTLGEKWILRSNLQTFTWHFQGRESGMVRVEWLSLLQAGKKEENIFLFNVYTSCWK